LDRLYVKASEQGTMTDKLFIDWSSRSTDSKSIFERGLQVFPSSYNLWLHLLESCTEEMNLQEKVHVYQKALDSVPREDSVLLWRVFLDYLTHQCNVKFKKENKNSSSVSGEKPFYIEDVENYFYQALSPQYLDGTSFESEMIEKFLEWSLQTCGIQRARRNAQSLVALKPRSSEFYLTCIALEEQAGSDEKAISKWFESAVTVDSKDMSRSLLFVMDSKYELLTRYVDLWLSYIRFLLTKPSKDFASASQVCWRASKNVTDKDEFLQKYENLKLSCC
jgi:hypothetical protein